jgi:hypothetical protein
VLVSVQPVEVTLALISGEMKFAEEEQMGANVLYLIEPLAALGSFLATRVGDKDFLEALLQPAVLTNHEGGKTDWTDEDHTLFVKLVFLASLHDYYPTQTDEGYAGVFGTDQLTTELFDQWWTIRRLEITNGTEWYTPDLAGALRRGKVGPIANHRVAERLAWYQQHAEPRVTRDPPQQ